MLKPLGVLMLDTNFPRPLGDLGNASSYPFPVKIKRIAGATPANAVHRPERRIVDDFIEGGRALAAAGCIGVTTTCGFLARWQDDIASALSVPFAASSLIAFPVLRRVMPAGRRLGIVTYSKADLDRDVLRGAGIDEAPPIAGVDPAGYFARVIREEDRVLDPERMAGDVLDASRRLLSEAPDVGGILLECANMPPYAERLRRTFGIPVFDPLTLACAFRRSLDEA